MVIKSPIQIKKILFATDFSFFSKKARDYTITLARKFKAEVDVLHAIETIYYLDRDDPEFVEWLHTLEQDLEHRMEETLDVFRRYGISARGELIFGTPWKVVVKYAEDRNMDLVVIGSHGLRTEEGQLLLGTTSHKIALTSPVPVLIVRPDEQDIPNMV